MSGKKIDLTSNQSICQTKLFKPDSTKLAMNKRLFISINESLQEQQFPVNNFIEQNAWLNFTVFIDIL